MTPSERSATLLEHMTAPRPKDDMERMLGLQVRGLRARQGRAGVACGAEGLACTIFPLTTVCVAGGCRWR